MKAQHLAPVLQTEQTFARFEWQNDRYRRTIGLLRGAKQLPLLTSIMSTSNDIWPIDPPLQQAVVETLSGTDRKAILAVGQTGEGHWSLACTAPMRQSQLEGRSSIQMDWACKARTQAERISSTYRLVSASHSSIELLSDRELVITCDAEHRLSLIVETGLLAMNEEQNAFSIFPHITPNQSTTHRWTYSFASR